MMRQQLRRFQSLPSAKLDPMAILSLPAHYLRAADASNLDSSTKQRIDVKFDRHTGKPPLVSSSISNESTEIVDCSLRDYHYYIQWKDGLMSRYSTTWVDDTLRLWESTEDVRTRVHVTGLTEHMVRSSSELRIDFDNVITEAGAESALHALHKYGILLVTDTPIDDSGAGVAALVSAVGGGSVKNTTSLVTHYAKQSGHGNVINLPHGTDGPLRTLYGTVWSTSSASQVSGASLADSAYGTEGLPLHTDLTYCRDPPGLQVFTMIQPSISGGESICCDGFAAAERLRQTNPEAFGVLATTVRRYYCIDETTGWHLEASGPLISVDGRGRVVMIRHNDLDRLPDLPPGRDLSDQEIDNFYETLQAAHLSWDRILAEDDMRLVLRLEPGDTMIVANQRWLHGRFSFVASVDVPRTIMGCYMSQDELNSRFRMLGLYAH